MLARRGAPLKVSAIALTEIAGRQALLPIVEECLDHALVAWVLNDEANDWIDDLRAGRWNAFVDWLAPAPQGWSDPRGRYEDVLRALLAGGRLLGYYGEIEHEAVRAAALADQVGIAPVAAHVRDFARRSLEKGVTTHNRFRAISDEATRLLFDAA